MSHFPPEVIVTIAMIASICLGGFCSGIALALFSLDPNQLAAYAASKSTNAEDVTRRNHARRILPLLKYPNWVLVSLLVCNCIAVEFQPMILEIVVSSFLAVVISVVSVLACGEILPQAFMVNNALPIAGISVYPLWIITFVTCPISWPVGKLLDYTVGHRQTKLYRRAGLREFIKMQAESESSTTTSSSSTDDPDSSESSTDSSDESTDDGKHQPHLKEREVQLMANALSMTELTVQSLMHPIQECICLGYNDEITLDVIEYVFKCGHSRIPVFHDGDRGTITHYFLVKELVNLVYYDPMRTGLPRVRNMHLIAANKISPDAKIVEAVDAFQRRKQRMIFVHVPMSDEEAAHSPVARQPSLPPETNEFYNESMAINNASMAVSGNQSNNAESEKKEKDGGPDAFMSKSVRFSTIGYLTDTDVTEMLHSTHFYDETQPEVVNSRISSPDGDEDDKSVPPPQAPLEFLILRRWHDINQQQQPQTSTRHRRNTMASASRARGTSMAETSINSPPSTPGSALPGKKTRGPATSMIRGPRQAADLQQSLLTPSESSGRYSARSAASNRSVVGGKPSDTADGKKSDDDSTTPVAKEAGSVNNYGGTS